eukprot:2219223-Pyramimonas_sp.AAC.1
MPGSFVGKRRPLAAADKATRVSFALGGGSSFFLAAPHLAQPWNFVTRSPELLYHGVNTVVQRRSVAHF